MPMKNFFETKSDHDLKLNFAQKYVDKTEPEIVEVEIILGASNVKKANDMYFFNRHSVLTGVFKKDTNGYVLQRVESIKSKESKKRVVTNKGNYSKQGEIVWQSSNKESQSRNHFQERESSVNGKSTTLAMY